MCANLLFKPLILLQSISNTTTPLLQPTFTKLALDAITAPNFVHLSRFLTTDHYLV